MPNFEKYLNEATGMRKLKGRDAKRAKKVVDDIDDYIGTALIKEFSEAESGDIDPMTQAKFETALENLVASWVADNVYQKD